MAYPSDLVRTKNWGTEILTDSDLEGQLDLIIAWVMAMANSSTGHTHDGTANKGPKVPVGSISTTGGTNGQVVGMSGGAITFVTAGGGADDIIARGFELVYNNTTTVIVNAGVLYHGSTKISKTANTTLTLATNGDWYDGSAHSYSGGAGWCYVGVDGSGNVKLLHTNAPNKADTAGNTAGTLIYYYDGATYWRVIGAFRVNTSDNVINKWHQQGNCIAYDVPISITTTLKTSWFTQSCATAIPAISQLALFGAYAGSTSSSYVSGVHIRATGDTGSTSAANGENTRCVAGTTQGSCELTSFTDSSQQIDYQCDASSLTNELEITVKMFFLNIR